MMKKNIGFNLLLIVLAAGLMVTMSCAGKTSVAESLAVTSADDVAAKKEAEKAKMVAAAAAEQKRQEAIKQAELAKERSERAASLAKYKFETENIRFDFDSCELSEAAKLLLKTKAFFMRKYPYVSARIEGHCDERGTTEYNLALGEKRALAVKSFLTDLGIAQSRLVTISFGEEKPLDSGRNETAYAVNRRAQFTVTK